MCKERENAGLVWRLVVGPLWWKHKGIKAEIGDEAREKGEGLDLELVP